MNEATTAVSTKRLLCARRYPGFISRRSLDAEPVDNGVNPVRRSHGNASDRNASDLSSGNVQRARTSVARLEVSFSGNEAIDGSLNDSEGKRCLLASCEMPVVNSSQIQLLAPQTCSAFPIFASSSLSSQRQYLPRTTIEFWNKHARPNQELLDAELLVALAREMPVSTRNSGQPETISVNEAITSPTQLLDQSHKPSELKRKSTKMYEDPELHDFVRRLTRLSRKKGIAPPLLMSCVVSESHLRDSRSKTHWRQEIDFLEKKERVTRALFELIWHQELESVFGFKRSQDDAEGPLECPMFGAIHEPLRGPSISAMTEELRLIAQHQLDEKSRAEKKIARKEKVKKWRRKKQGGQNFSSTIRYPARQHLARKRPRIKGQFVSVNTPAVSQAF